MSLIPTEPPKPLTPAFRAELIRQYAAARQSEYMTRDPATCGLALLYDDQLRDLTADRFMHTKEGYAALLELDDRLTGGDFMVDLMVHLMPADADTREKIVDMLGWHRFHPNEYQPRLDAVVERHMAAVGKRKAAA